MKPEQWVSPLVQEKYDKRHPYRIIIIIIIIIIITKRKSTRHISRAK